MTITHRDAVAKTLELLAKADDDPLYRERWIDEAQVYATLAVARRP
jgi:hypothetical protein